MKRTPKPKPTKKPARKSKTSAKKSVDYLDMALDAWGQSLAMLVVDGLSGASKKRIKESVLMETRMRHAVAAEMRQLARTAALTGSLVGGIIPIAAMLGRGFGSPPAPSAAKEADKGSAPRVTARGKASAGAK